MIIFNYANGIHPESGKTYDVINDIIVTPLWTKEFCADLVNVAKHYSDRFSNDIKFTKESEKIIGWDDILVEQISPIFFQDFVRHYKQDICPILEKVYTKASSEIHGWFSPYIIRYDRKNQRTDLHHDASSITLNIKLNDDYTGCDLTFPRQQFNAKNIPVGYAMIWPSTVTHPHYSTPLVEGEKYSFVSWSWPPAWDPRGIRNI